MFKATFNSIYFKTINHVNILFTDIHLISITFSKEKTELCFKLLLAFDLDKSRTT